MAEMRDELCIIGLGRMGGGIALHARELGFRVLGLDPSGLRAELRDAGVEEVGELHELRRLLAAPRVVFLYVPAGPAVDDLLDALFAVLSPGDVVADGGNSYWGDSIARQRRAQAHGICFVDLGTSGGIEGARHGACFMAGGTAPAVGRVAPILRALAVEGGYVHAGPPGAGHFTKLVHNGIEFGMLQAIGEGVDLLERYPDKLDVGAILACFRHGSVIRGWLMDLMHAAYVQEGGLANVPPIVDDTGEVNWLVGDALRMEVPIPVIAQAVMELFASRDDKKNWARAIAMMRHGFGGHAYGVNPAAEQERRHGHVDRPMLSFR
jgi:6-phosphogluconate dehydrogenase